MGTKVEDKACVPGYFDMADSSVNSNGNVLRYYEKSKQSLCISDKFTFISANGSVHYDKEMLKRTMLAHEATFQKQVYELHRLYKIQKDLMAQFQGEEFNSHPRYADTLLSRSYASQVPPGDVKGVWQTKTPTSDHDLKKSSIDFINETSSQYSVNRASLRPNNESIKKMLDLQHPVDVYDNGDDDVEILDEKPLKSLPGTNVPLRGGNFDLNIGNSESKHVEKSWTTEIQRHNSTVHVLNKPVEGSSNMYQKQRYLSQGLNLNLLALQGNSREKHADKVSGSCFFGSNEEGRHINSFGWRKEHPNTRIEWLQPKQNGSISSVGCYLYSDTSSNHLIHAPPLFNDALNSPWQSNNTSYLTKGHYGISVGSTSNTTYHHPLKIHGEPQFWKPAPSQNYLKDLNLNDMPADTTATWEQGSENSMVDTSRFEEKQVNLLKSQVPLRGANDLSQTFLSSTLHSEDRTLTRTPSFPISAAAAEKDSGCSPALECDINIATLIKHDADKDMQPQSENADSSIKNLFDLNEALPIMDDPEMQCESEGDISPPEPDDPSRDSLAITAAENLMAICKDRVQRASPELDTLHWFAELATLKENTICECDNDGDDDFEALTLKLEEIKGYEYHSTPRTQEGDSNDGHRSAASLLVTGPRSSKVRGRPPKKKNFQKDILPGLASLPEQEVSEDLRALGRSKPATSAKRGGRKGRQQRGIRRAKSVAVLVKEAEVSLSPAPPPLVTADLETDEPRITRWGRTTRRCRRPRCPPANNASLHVA